VALHLSMLQDAIIDMAIRYKSACLLYWPYKQDLFNSAVEFDPLTFWVMPEMAAMAFHNEPALVNYVTWFLPTQI